MERATLARREDRVESQDLRVLSLRAEGADRFGQRHIALLCGAPQSGGWRVLPEAVAGTEAGTVQLVHQEKAMGDAVDLCAAATTRRARLFLGAWELREGGGTVFLNLVGRNPSAAAPGVEVVTLTLERQPR